MDKTSFRFKAFNILCLVLIASTCFSNLLHLPYTGNKVQVTEIVFLIMLPFLPVKEVICHLLKNLRTLCIFIITYLIFDLASSVFSQRLSAIIESCGRFYLFSLFAILSYYFSMLSKTELFTKLRDVLIITTVLILMTALVGYLAVLSGNWSSFIYPAYNYPYFGTFYRFRGPTIYPSMMVSIGICYIAYFLGLMNNFTRNKPIYITLLAILICTALTLSKSLLLAGLLLLVFLSKKLGYLTPRILIVFTVLVTLVLETFTHVIVQRQSGFDGQIPATNYTSGHVLHRSSKWNILETPYLNFKNVELDIFSDHPFFGTGTGSFSKNLPKYIQNETLPKFYEHYDPHSTYFGALAENGIFATLGLIALFGYIFRLFYKCDNLLKDDFLLALFMAYLCFLIDGICTDILNFRHLWVFLAIAVTYLNMEQTTSDKHRP